MTTCKISCVSTGSDSRRFEFWTPPVASNVQQEVDADDLTQWTFVNAAYGTVNTGSGREVWKARTQIEEVSAVFMCDWTAVTAAITSMHAIRINQRHYQIITAINVDEANYKMNFWCRSSRNLT